MERQVNELLAIHAAMAASDGYGKAFGRYQVRVVQAVLDATPHPGAVNIGVGVVLATLHAAPVTSAMGDAMLPAQGAEGARSRRRQCWPWCRGGSGRPQAAGSPAARRSRRWQADRTGGENGTGGATVPGMNPRPPETRRRQ